LRSRPTLASNNRPSSSNNSVNSSRGSYQDLNTVLKQHSTTIKSSSQSSYSHTGQLNQPGGINSNSRNQHAATISASTYSTILPTPPSSSSSAAVAGEREKVSRLRDSYSSADTNQSLDLHQIMAAPGYNAYTRKEDAEYHHDDLDYEPPEPNAIVRTRPKISSARAKFGSSTSSELLPHQRHNQSNRSSNQMSSSTNNNTGLKSSSSSSSQSTTAGVRSIEDAQRLMLEKSKELESELEIYKQENNALKSLRKQQENALAEVSYEKTQVGLCVFFISLVYISMYLWVDEFICEYMYI
jgi:hypothetical protein